MQTKTYLSFVNLNDQSRHAQRAMAQPQLLHGAVEGAFLGERARRLYRIDPLAQGSRLLLLSQQQPDLLHIARQFGFPDQPASMGSMDYTPLLAQLRAGQRWRFRLKANPVQAAWPKDKAKPRGQVHAHVTVHQQAAWLLKRARQHGFSLEEDQFTVVHSAWQRFKKADNNQVVIKTATFEGFLTVEDPQLLQTALCQGIGRAKAYGCGLLTLARP